MKTAVYYKNSDIRIEERPVPEISEDELLIKVKACGICGSDVMEWYRIKKAPLILGHELAGDVVKVGSKVKGFKPGDRVVVTHHVPCNTCHYCLKGHHSVCDTLRTTTFYPGGFAEYLRVPAINVDRGTFLLPEGMSYHEGVFVEPLGCVYRGLRMANFKPGQDVLIIGCGVTGLLFIKTLKALGAGRITAVDINQFKLDNAAKMGAGETLHATGDAPGALRAQTGGRLADLVVLTAGAPSAVDMAISTVGRGGTILFFAPPGPDQPVNLPMAKFWKDEVTITTSYAAPPEDLQAAITLISSGRVEIKDMISHRFPLAETGKGFELAAASEKSLKVVIDVDQ